MRLGFMQPYFFPYLGYFSLIANTDRWVIFDNAQYIRRGWVNRNRVIKNGSPPDWKYIGIPVEKAARSATINEIRIKQTNDWRQEIINQLDYYKRFAPNYHAVIELIRDCLGSDSDFLCDHLERSLERVCKYMGIPFFHERLSQMDLQLGEISEPGRWALEVSAALGAETYINPPGGRDIFDRMLFENHGIQLRFLEIDLFEYQQNLTAFIPGLSIIDVLMFNNQEIAKQYLTDYRLEV